MFHRPLIPLDRSEDAGTILDHVVPLPAPDAEAVLLHVLPEPRPLAADNLQSWLDLQKQTEDDVAEEVLRYADRPVLLGPPSRMRVAVNSHEGA